MKMNNFITLFLWFVIGGLSACVWGFHCAPNAHKTLGSYPEGTIRFSFGFNNDSSAVDAVTEIINGL